LSGGTTLNRGKAAAASAAQTSRFANFPRAVAVSLDIPG
jgi:hypothetical protein